MNTIKDYLIISFLLLILSYRAFFQSPKGSPFIWGELSESDRGLTVYETEPDASALILFDYGEKMQAGKVELGLKQSYHRYLKIKILKRPWFQPTAWAPIQK